MRDSAPRYTAGIRRYIGLFSLLFAVGCQATEPVAAADLIAT